jgi:hypothetical protein
MMMKASLAVVKNVSQMIVFRCSLGKKGQQNKKASFLLVLFGHHVSIYM